jgi:hypothetical protein
MATIVRLIQFALFLWRYRCEESGLKFVEEGLHFAGGVGVVGALGGGEAFFQAGDGFLSAAEFGECLGGHLVAGDVIGVVVDEGGEFGESEVGVALGVVFHCEAVAGEGVGGVGGEDFGEGGDLVHELMVASESV